MTPFFLIRGIKCKVWDIGFGLKSLCLNLTDLQNLTYQAQHMANLNMLYHDDPDISKGYAMYLSAREMIWRKDEFDVERILKRAYQALDELRHAFTGQPVEYHVGVTYGGKKNLHEGVFSLEQILKITRAEAITASRTSMNNMFKLRLVTSKTNLQQNMNLNQPAVGAHSTLWASIVDYASGSNWNTGNLFEAYKVLKNRVGTNHTGEFNPTEFDEIFLAVRQNSGSFLKGGDMKGLDGTEESVKFFDKNPSLASISTLKNGLQEFVRIIDTLSPQDAKLGLMMLFERKEYLNWDAITDFLVENGNSDLQDVLSELKGLRLL